ncbi:ParB/RepB/Spo0J family partition protein [Inediibacterium massiliense]|uniref:ParB/RepB/Spo0J family partition protein n=1 Tax=Inediibacterium massiliense TaxID=1658111 RepID=UPI0006B4BBF5|nr:ParB/RepB/Spo0J family partition protein [Inediibacterium massiliense]
MAKRRNVLGKGLSALIPDKKDDDIQNENKGNIEMISIHKIRPNKNQPRKHFNKEKLETLSESIKNHGVIQPIVIRPIGQGYEIIAGERRWKACKQAELDEIPCIIKEIDEQGRMEIALIENIQREDLNPIEEAFAYKNLMEKYKVTQEEISCSIGKSRPYIANTVRLLNLTEEVQNMLIDQLISSGHARALLRIGDHNLQKQLAEGIIQNGLSVRETENIITKMLENKKEQPKPKIKKDNHISYIEDVLKERLGTKVNIIKGKKKGKIEIEYYSEDELERLIEVLRGSVS